MGLTPMPRQGRRTQSVCPVCLGRVDAEYLTRGDEIWLQKACPTHGFFEALVWAGADSFFAWSPETSPAADLPPQTLPAAGFAGCPYECGLCENHRQTSCCVLLELTARCNLACPVCFASAGKDPPVFPDPDLTTIAGWYDRLMETGGPFNIQLSGGEPSLRGDLPEIIRLGRQRGFRFFQLNTNGLRLGEEPGYAQELQRAGLCTVFLQFDSLRSAPSITLRGRPLLSAKQKAIENCGQAGLGVVLVPTLKPGCNDSELWDILEYAAAQSPVVRGVHFQPISYFGRHGGPPAPQAHLTLPGVLAALEHQSRGRVKSAHFLPGGTEHPLCSFHADYDISGGQWLPLHNTGCTSCAGPLPRPSSRRARLAVAQKWSATPQPEAAGKGSHDSLDSFLSCRSRHTLAVSGMLFQDAWTLDLERLQHCHIHVVSRAGSLVPFCAYNLSAQDGHTLYRNR